VRLLAAAALLWVSVAIAFQEEISVRSLPPEGRETLALIKAGGPFPFQRDGIVFSNYQGVLPKRNRGFYREYTVITPGLRNRGARRIVAGGGVVFYYTEDHYSSFRRIVEP
jgi:ribonuclease T1